MTQSDEQRLRQTVAEAVGWTIREGAMPRLWWAVSPQGFEYPYAADSYEDAWRVVLEAGGVPDYPHDVHAALDALLTVCGARGVSFSFDGMLPPPWAAYCCLIGELGSTNASMGKADTLPLAICRAIAAAVAGEKGGGG